MITKKTRLTVRRQLMILLDGYCGGEWTIELTGRESGSELRGIAEAHNLEIDDNGALIVLTDEAYAYHVGRDGSVVQGYPR